MPRRSRARLPAVEILEHVIQPGRGAVTITDHPNGPGLARQGAPRNVVSWDTSREVMPLASIPDCRASFSGYRVRDALL